MMQSKVNDLYWLTQGVNATMKRKLFLAAFIEVHNVAVEDSIMEFADIGRQATETVRLNTPRVPVTSSDVGRFFADAVAKVRRLLIEVPEE